MKRIAMFLLLCTAIQTLAQSPYSSLQIPKVISYQGRVTQNGTPWSPGTGEGYFVFALVQNGSVLWNNYDGNANPSDPASRQLGVDEMLPLSVSGGQFSVRLGGTGSSGKNREIPATVFFDANNNSVRGGVKLAVWFSADANTFTRLSPDVDFSSVPYALVAGIAETLPDRAVATRMLMDAATTAAQIADGAVTTSKLPDNAVTTNKVADSTITTAKLVAAVTEALVPPGTILPYGGTTAPPGYLLCDGAPVSRTVYAALFAAISNSYGAPNGTTFNVPDLRGRFLRGSIPNLQAVGSGVVTSNNVTTTQTHPFTRTGMVVQVSGTQPTGLTPAGTTREFYIININSTTVAFANSQADALAGTKRAISGSATGLIITQAEDPEAASRAASALGGNTGNNVGSAQQDMFQSHKHEYLTHYTSIGAAGSGWLFDDINDFTPSLQSVGNRIGLPINDPVNGMARAGFETRSKNVSVNYIIKY